jgi:phage antirepressor YoqD-like protein
MPKFVDPSNPENVIEVPEEFRIEVDKVDGETKTWTAEEAINKARAGASATQRFQEASELRKQVEAEKAEWEKQNEEMKQKAEFLDLIDRAKTDNDAYREVAEANGLSREQADDMLRQAGRLQDQQTPGNTGNTGNTNTNTNTGTNGNRNSEGSESNMSVDKEQLKQALEELNMSPDQFSAVTEMSVRQAREQVVGDLRRAIDNDPQLGKLNEGQKQHLVENSMFSAALEKLQSGNEGWRPDMAVSALDPAKKLATDLGIMPKATDDAQAEETKRRSENFLKAAETVGPVEEPVRESIEQGKLPKKPKMSDPQYSGKMTQYRLMQLAQDGAPGSKDSMGGSGADKGNQG